MATQLTSAQVKQLTPAQRKIYNGIMKDYEARLNPVRTAKIKLEDELRQKAYTDLNIAERVKAVEEPLRARLAEIDAQQKALDEQWREVMDELKDVTGKIQCEPWTYALSHPAVKVLSEMWDDINDTQAKALDAFLDALN